MKKPPRKRTLMEKLDTFGMSFASAERIGDLVPYIPLRQAVRGMADFLLKAESREEIRWLLEGVPVLERHFEKKVELDRSKAVSFKLPGGIYTPDFFYILEDGRRIHIEVKGSKFQPNYRDARSKIRTAATLYWFDTFCEARIEEKQWVIEIIEIDEEYRTDFQAFLNMLRDEQEAVSANTD